MLPQLLLILATSIHGASEMITGAEVVLDSPERYTRADKYMVIQKLSHGNNTDDQTAIIHILQNYTLDFDEMEKTLKGPDERLREGERILKLLNSNISNPFNMLALRDAKYGGSIIDMEKLSEVIESICTMLNKKDTFQQENAQSRINDSKTTNDQKKENKVADKINRAVEEIRKMVKKFLISHESENPYWSRGIVLKGLEEVNRAGGSVSDKAQAIEAFLSNIMTRDQFVIIVTNLCTCYEIPNASSRFQNNLYNTILIQAVYIKKTRDSFFKQKHTLVVIRTSNVTRPYIWEKMGKDNHAIKQLFNCEKSEERKFLKAMEIVGATSAVHFNSCDPQPEFAFINVNSDGKVDIPGWYTNGDSFSNHFNTSDITGRIKIIFRNHFVALCF